MPPDFGKTPHEYKLTYFNAMGRAEAARLIFAQADVKYEDIRVKTEDWLLLKPKTPMGQLPVLEVDGRQMCQSIAICRYLAGEFGLLGADSWEAARCDMLALGVDELSIHFKTWFAEKDPQLKMRQWRELEKNHVRPFLFRYERFLTENGSGYFVGQQLTWADLLLYSMISFWGAKLPDMLKNFDQINAFVGRIGSLPRIKAWLDKRPVTDW